MGLSVVVEKLEVVSPEMARCIRHQSTDHHRDAVEEAAGLVDTRVDQAEDAHPTAAGRESVLDNPASEVSAAAFSDLYCRLRGCQDFVVETAAQKPVLVQAEAMNHPHRSLRLHTRCHRTSPDPAPSAASGHAVAEAAVARDSHFWAHQRSGAAVSSADPVVVWGPERTDLLVAAAVAVLRSHSRNLADRRGHNIGGSLSTKRKGSPWTPR